MITYGFSLQGKSHIKKDVVCQDFNCIKALKNGWYVLAVADGVGSAKHSEDGSKTAVETAVGYCLDNIKSNIKVNQVLEILKNAYQQALKQVEEFCENSSGKIEDYDTTLTVAIYTGNILFYGHAGDGGIIVKDCSGKYELVTTLQKGADGISVRPLRAGKESWEFGVIPKEVAAVFLATDGMLDTVLPPLLNIGQIQANPMANSTQKNVYITLAEFFMNADSVYKNRNIKNPDKFIQNFLACDVSEEQFNQCLYNSYMHAFGNNVATAICNTVQVYNYSVWKINKVDDDKTVVCAINEKQKVTIGDPEYYAEPDWRELQQEFDKLAYPSLYEKDKTEKKSTEQKDVDYTRVKLTDTKNTNQSVKTGKKATEHMPPMENTREIKRKKKWQINKWKRIVIISLCILMIIVVFAVVALIMYIKDETRVKKETFDVILTEDTDNEEATEADSDGEEDIEEGPYQPYEMIKNLDMKKM